MANTSRSISSSKTAFLNTQLRILNTPLTSSFDNAPSSPLPGATLDSLLTKINKKISKHNRLAFSVESRRHVVEQIDTLYWRDVLAGGLPVRKAETVIRRHADVTSAHGLPELWEDVVVGDRPRKRRRVVRGGEDADANETETEAGTVAAVDAGSEEQQAEKYAALRTRLQAQAERLARLRRKRAQLQKLHALLEPLQNPRECVQPNLVTRDNSVLESELAKMRVLLARAGTRVQSSGDVGVRSERPGPQGERAGDDRTRDVKRLESVLALG